MMSHFPVVFCATTLRANTLIQEGTDGIRWNQRLSSVHLFIVVISFPSPSCVPSLPSCLFTLSSAPHLPPTPLVYILLLVISPCLLISSVFRPSHSVRPCSRWPPNWNISSANRGTEREMLFRGNFRGAGLSCRFLSSEPSCQRN